MRKWGYRADGSAHVFDLSDGGKLPPGWDEDLNVIADPAKRTGDALSAASKLPLPADPPHEAAAPKPKRAKPETPVEPNPFAGA